MALTQSISSVGSALRSGSRHCCRCSSTSPQIVSRTTPRRTFSSSHPYRSVSDCDTPTQATPSEDQPVRPRWSYTPERMKAPFSINIPKNPERQIWAVNEDPAKVDAMYTRFLGVNVARTMDEELKWLAITHKSFDQGRRGYNTRLGYFGSHVLKLEVTKSILFNQSQSPSAVDDKPDPYGRQPFEHPALDNIDRLSLRHPQDIIGREKLSRLAMNVGINEVVRWKPKVPERLVASGLHLVLNTTVLAIIGAISLQYGAASATKLVQERVLKRIVQGHQV